MFSKHSILRLVVKVKNSKIVRTSYSQIEHGVIRFNNTNYKVRNQLFQSIPFWIASSITGMFAYAYSMIFKYTEKLSLFLIEHFRWSVFIITPLTFFLSWWLVNHYASFAKGSGIPQVMTSLELSKPKTKTLIDKFLSLKIILIKVLSSALKVLGGGVIGREGPTVQISSSVFKVIYKYLPPLWRPISQKNILVAGAASGLAAAFNTPLGGIIFAIEELSKFHLKQFGSTLFVAVVIAGLVSQTLGGSYLYLGYPSLTTSGWIIYLGILVVSVISGFFGAKTGQYLWYFVIYFKKFKTHKEQIIIVLTISLLLSTTIFIFGSDAMGTGKEIMERTLFTDHKSVAWYIPFVRMFGMMGAFLSGGSGGIFAPSLSIGAAIGSVVCSFMEISGNNANLMIVIGMVSFLTGITRSPFTSAIIIIEMTDRHSSIFHIMLAVVITSTIAYMVEKKSFYDHLKEAYLDEAKLEQINSSKKNKETDSN